MTYLLALLLAAAPPPDSADRAMLDSFKSACSRTGDLEAMKADALAAGWQSVADDSDPRLGRLIRKGRAEAGSDSKLSGAAFRRTESGRELFLILSRVDAAEGYWAMGCRAYDFAATEPLAAASLEAWMGRPPTGVEEPAPGLVRRLWEPGWRDGVTVEAAHIAPGHPLGEPFGLQGNVLTAQAIGGF